MDGHLSDNSTYQLVHGNNVTKILNKIYNLCNFYKSSFTKKEFNFLTKFHPVMPFLYELLKLHKHNDYFSSVIPVTFNYIMISPPVDLKFRLIISSRFAPMSRLISAFLNEF